MTLTEFLLARISEDEAAALAAGSSGDDQHWWVDGPAKVSGKWWIYSTGEKFAHEHTARHIARHDPARVLAECEAKRRIVELFPSPAPVDSWDEAGERVLEMLALPYADHPDYREEGQA